MNIKNNQIDVLYEIFSKDILKDYFNSVLKEIEKNNAKVKKE